MRVTVDADLCCGHGRCYELAPNAYSSDDEGFNARKGTTFTVPPGAEADARTGAAACPEVAITIDES